LQNRCKTFKQRSFNFQSYNALNAAEIDNSQNPAATAALLKAAKPGDPLSVTNTYFANCQPNAEIEVASEITLINILLEILKNKNIITQEQYNDFKNKNIYTFISLYEYLQTLPKETKDVAVALFIDYVNNPYIGVPLSGPSNPIGCKLVVYKPSNAQYATQGAVESSTRTLKLNVTTIEKNAASYYKNPAGKYINRSNVSDLVLTNIPFLYKNKPATYCESPPLNFYPTTYQNKKACRYIKKPEYFTPLSQASPYRYYFYYNSPFSRLTNHYRQSPNSNTLL